MTRTNLILLVVLALVAGTWWLRRDPARHASTAPASRLFPTFNKETADRIHIEGGWRKDVYEFTKLGSAWQLSSGGGFPVKAEEVGKFIDAVYQLRRENFAGNSAELRAETGTGDGGRVVTIFRGETEPVAEFVVGRKPEGEYEYFFVRRADEDDVYRVRTLLSEDVDDAVPSGPLDQGRKSGFAWDNYTNSLYRWADTKIWDLSDGEVKQIELTRPGADGEEEKIVLTLNDDESWSIAVDGGEPAPADTAAVNDIKNRIGWLTFEEVVGSIHDVDKHGLAKGTSTIVFHLEKEPEEKPGDGDTPEEGEEGEEKPKPEPEKFTRALTVGAKVSIPKSRDAQTGEVTEKEFYPAFVAGVAGMDTYIFLLDDYKGGALQKPLADLRPEPKKDDEEEGEETGEGAEEPSDEPATPPPGDGDEEPETPPEDTTEPEEDPDTPPDEEPEEPAEPE